jgi:hypothetical protein
LIIGDIWDAPGAFGIPVGVVFTIMFVMFWLKKNQAEEVKKVTDRLDNQTKNEELTDQLYGLSQELDKLDALQIKNPAEAYYKKLKLRDSNPIGDFKTSDFPDLQWKEFYTKLVARMECLGEHQHLSDQDAAAGERMYKAHQEELSCLEAEELSCLEAEERKRLEEKRKRLEEGQGRAHKDVENFLIFILLMVIFGVIGYILSGDWRH